MLAAQWVLFHYAIERSLAPEQSRRLTRYFELQQQPDGAFGLHEESHGYLFTTVLCYAALRLLGHDLKHPVVSKAHSWLIGKNVTEIPTWGKMWLALVGLYDWRGVPPTPPELWLLPAESPVHPRRYYCHTRLIYLGFSYLYGVRFTGPITDAILSIRGELYSQGFDKIDWKKSQTSLFDSDIHVPPSRWLQTSYHALNIAEPLIPRGLRKYALKECLRRIRFEVDVTSGQGISPVNGMLCAMALHHAGDQQAEHAWAELSYWVWEDDLQGARVAGAMSHTWDSAFAAQAMAHSRDAIELPRELEAFTDGLTEFLVNAQVRDELPEEYASHDRLPVKGGYCFGEPGHRWPVSDCTAEALLGLDALHTDLPLGDDALDESVQFILRRQNSDGGFGSYENQRGFRVLEALNPSEMFGGCMSEYSYLECTSSCVQALAAVLKSCRKRLSASRQREMQRAIARGAKFIRASQRPDGSWFAVWGVCFTYGALFGIRGLRAAGASPHDPAIKRACRWLIDHEHKDGAWGEHWSSCRDGQYVESATPQVIQTAWAIMALLEAGGELSTHAAVQRGTALLLEKQLMNGAWPTEGQAGIFFDTAGLHYDLYRTTFPLTALSMLKATDEATDLRV
jgi:lanosterol synthase